MPRLRFILALALLGLAFTGSASAMSFTLITYENADGADLDGLNLWFEVEDSGSYVDFTFYNSSTIASNVANIYFERNGAGLDLGASSIHGESQGVDFRSGGAPGNPAPGGGSLDWSGTAARFRAENPAPHNGTGNTDAGASAEWLTIRFEYGSSSYASVISDLESGEFRITQHVTSMPQSIWTVSGGVTDPVPLPATVWLLGSGLLGWVGANRVRRRK